MARGNLNQKFLVAFPSYSPLVRLANIPNMAGVLPNANPIKALDRICNILKDKERNMIIVHGAGSYGHPIAKRYALADGLDGSQEQKKAIDETR